MCKILPSEENNMSLSSEIKVIRKKAFLSQAEFAKELNVVYSTVNRWENGKGRPNSAAMKALRAFCDKNSISYTELETAWIEESIN